MRDTTTFKITSILLEWTPSRVAPEDAPNTMVAPRAGLNSLLASLGRPAFDVMGEFGPNGVAVTSATLTDGKVDRMKALLYPWRERSGSGREWEAERGRSATLRGQAPWFAITCNALAPYHLRAPRYGTRGPGCVSLSRVDGIQLQLTVTVTVTVTRDLQAHVQGQTNSDALPPRTVAVRGRVLGVCVRRVARGLGGRVWAPSFSGRAPSCTRLLAP